jgi:hypothetical protein
LIAVVDAAIFLGEHEINEVLQEEPWSAFNWSVDGLPANPKQIKEADPDDDYLGSDLRELVYGLRDAREFLTMLKGLKGRCEQCATPSEKLYECDKAYLCEPCREKWENG